MKALAVLAPEIPSVSATFVYREALALEKSGYSVSLFSLHEVPTANVGRDGLTLVHRTEVLYGRPGRLLLGAAAFALFHPFRSCRVLATAFRDLYRGDFSEARQRRRLPVQAIAGLALARKLRRAGVQHLHVHFANSPATVGMYASIASGIPFSVTSHANDIYVEAALLREKIERANPFVTISDYNRCQLRHQFGPLADRVQVVHCGVDCSALVPYNADPATEMGLDTGQGEKSSRPRSLLLHVLAVGRLVPKKGFDLLLHSLARMPDLEQNFVVEIVGDGPERARLESLRTQLGLEQRVRFCGALPNEEVQTMLSRAALFVLPCRIDDDGDRDGIPVSLMEAMATGIPVLAGDVSGIAELVITERTGLLVDAEDTLALARALSRLLVSHPLRKVLSENARQHVQNEFDQHSNARQLGGLLSANALSLAAT